jgi:hypothetical protein
MYYAKLTNTGWRIFCDYIAIGGHIADICGAANQQVAIATTTALNQRKAK